jgi:hypothetical protein
MSTVPTDVTEGATLARLKAAHTACWQAETLLTEAMSRVEMDNEDTAVLYALLHRAHALVEASGFLIADDDEGSVERAIKVVTAR